MRECWHFVCPECGFGDRERGELAPDHEIVCEICLEDNGIHIRLRRWQPEGVDQEQQPT